MLEGIFEENLLQVQNIRTYQLMNQRDPAEAKEGNLFLNWESNCAVFTS